MSKRAFDDSEAQSDIAQKKLKTDSVLSRETRESVLETATNKTTTQTGSEVVSNSDPSSAANTDTAKDADFGLAEMLFVEHAVGNLRTAIKDIIAQAPNKEKFELIQQNADIKSNEVLMALKRSKLPLAAQLKSLYEKNELKIFDDIINFEDRQSIHVDKANINLGTDAIEAAKKKQEEEAKKAGYEDGYPPLPEIKNAALKAQVFIHKSLIKDKIFLSKKEIMHAHNERLEFLGDSILNNIMSLIAYNKFPFATEGELSQLRTRLISNATLQTWSFHYGLDKLLKHNTADNSLEKGKMKIYADVFEAYVGGLIIDNSSNYPIVYSWLEALAEKLLNERSDSVVTRAIESNKASDLHANAKVELYSLIGYASLGLNYHTVTKKHFKDISEFVVQVRTREGDVLGTGTGKNTKEAGLRAAMDALSNKEVIEKYSKIRASIPRSDSIKPSALNTNDENQKKEKQQQNLQKKGQGPDGGRQADVKFGEAREVPKNCDFRRDVPTGPYENRNKHRSSRDPRISRGQNRGDGGNGSNNYKSNTSQPKNDYKSRTNDINHGRKYENDRF